MDFRVGLFIISMDYVSIVRLLSVLLTILVSGYYNKPEYLG